MSRSRSQLPHDNCLVIESPAMHDDCVEEVPQEKSIKLFWSLIKITLYGIISSSILVLSCT